MSNVAVIDPDISPGDIAKLRPILKHIDKKGGGFHTACMRTKGVMAKFPDPKSRAAVCARLKDLEMGTTEWRKGNQKKG